LIGREKEIGEFAHHCRRLASPTLFYLEGRGGVGKTAIVEEVLERLRRGDIRGWRGRAPRRLIDLYHIDFQTPTGLAEGIRKALGSPPIFSTYTAEVEKLRQRARRGDLKREEWKRIWRLFAQALSQLAKREEGLVLALDTVEVLQYTRDPFQEEVKRTLPLASVGQWMLEEVFPYLEGPILWIWAGRPTLLVQRLRTVDNLQLVIQRLKPLNREESLAYLEAVAVRLQEQGAVGVERLRDYVASYPAGLYRGTGGRPILLALTADILRVGADLPTPFYAESEEGAQGDRDSQEALERMMMEHLLAQPSPEVKALLALGWLRKGANAALLGRLLDLDETRATTLLEALAELVLVKRRPQADHPYFLHDELYYLLERYREIEPEKRARLYQKIHAYYAEREKEVLEKLRGDIDPWSRTRYEARRRAIQVERLHYQLYDDPRAGFETYFLRAEDALDSRDTDLDMLLRSELLRVVADLQQAERLSKDLVAQVYKDAAVRWGVRVLLLHNDPEGAAETFREVRGWIAKTTQPLDTSWRRYMRLYEAVIALKKGDYEQARRVLEEVEDGFLNLTPGKVVAVLRAFTAAYLGYLERLQGEYFQAVTHYQKATALFRRLGMGALISTLTNLAYAMAMVGRFRHARQVLGEARERADQEGQPHWLARILNVRAIVEALDGHSRTALRHADDAQVLFEVGKVSDERLRGLLHITRARAYRYLWNDFVRERRWRDGLEDPLLRAYEEGEKGLSLIKETERQGSYYHVEALTETGCVLREMAWTYRKIAEREALLTEDVFEGDRERLFQGAARRAEDRFWRAGGVENREASWKPQIQRRIKEDLGGDAYLPTLALTNLGWHYHYQRRAPEEITALCELIEELIGPAYRLPELTVEKESANLLLWAVLGKMEMLRFHELLRGWERWDRAERDVRLKQAVRRVTYSLEYDYLVGRNSYDLRRAEAGLHQRLISLPEWDVYILPRFYRYGEEVAEELQAWLRGRESAFLRWLRENFGEREIWQELSEEE